jgi:hypothetical protein
VRVRRPKMPVLYTLFGNGGLSINTPRVFDMLQQMGSAAPGDGNGVETVLVRGGRIRAHPCPCNVRDLAPLGPCDGIERVAPSVAGASFHFDECDGMAAASDDVDFLVTRAIVAFEDAPAAGREKLAGKVFGPKTEIV